VNEYYGEAPPAPNEPWQQLNCWVLSDKDATVAKVELYASNGETLYKKSATGSAKRERGDSYDQEIGDLLALGRALSKLGRKLEKQAQSKINATAAIKAHHEAIARKKADDEAAKIRARLDQVTDILTKAAGHVPSFTWADSTGLNYTVTKGGTGRYRIDVIGEMGVRPDVPLIVPEPGYDSGADA
jgi:hypothetical protein